MTELYLAVAIVLIVILLWIKKKSKKESPVSPPAPTTLPPPTEGMQLPTKKRLNPEAGLFELFSAGAVDKLNRMDDPHNDEVIVLSKETETDRFTRSLYAADGPAAEGMTASYDDMEMAAMVRQEQKLAKIYGEDSLGYTQNAVL